VPRAVNEEIRRTLEAASNLCRCEENEEALKLVEEALEQHPNDLELKAMLGVVLSRVERDREAEAVLRAVLKRDPEHEQATSTLGRLLDNSLRTEEAEELYRSFMGRKPACHVVLDDLCRLLLDEERVDEAYKLARAHADQFPAVYEAYSPLQRVLQTQEDEIREKADEAQFDRKGLTKLTSNLIEQFEVILKMEREIGSETLNTIGHAWELDEEIIRIAAELDYIEDAFRKQRASVPSALQSAIQAIHAERGKRAKIK